LENAEFITFRVSQNNPSLGSLAYVCVSRAESDKAFDLGFLVVRPEIEVKSILAGLGLRYRNEEKSGKAIFTRSYLKLVGLVVDDDPTERLLPPTAERFRIFRVDVCLLPFEAHAVSVGGTASPKAHAVKAGQRAPEQSMLPDVGPRRLIPRDPR